MGVRVELERLLRHLRLLLLGWSVLLLEWSILLLVLLERIWRLRLCRRECLWVLWSLIALRSWRAHVLVLVLIE